jgi:DNA (cytosine-5)-methyltransferase 1
VNVDNPIRHLDVCAGAGGFALGFRLVAPNTFRTVGYVERDPFAASVLLARMEDQTLDRAAVFVGSVEDVDGGELRGEVDLITAGFPCQPYSVAGKRLGAADERAIWPSIAGLIASVAPSAVLLENVSLNAFREPWRDLRELGFELAPPVQIGAGHIGAPQRRLRYFALAYRDDGRLEGEMADCGSERLQGKLPSRAEARAARRSDRTKVADAAHSMGAVPGLRELPLQHPPGEARPRMHMSPGGGLGDQPIPTYPPGPEGDWATVPAELHPATAEPELRRVVDGVSDRMDRLRVLGNAVLPQVVAAAWRELTR